MKPKEWWIDSGGRTVVSDEWAWVYYDIAKDYIFLRHLNDLPMLRLLLGEIIALGPL